MKKSFLLCILSALAGAAIATVALTDSPISATAQEPSVGRADHGRHEPILRLPVPEKFSSRQDDDLMTPEERVNVAVYENVNRSVVNINTKVVRNNNLFMLETHGEGEGSGSVIDRAGHVLTNSHVIEGAREIQVTLYDGKSYDARVVGKDDPTDIAVLKIDAPQESLHPVELGDSARLKVGQKVYAIGNPFGLERTLTTGIISSLNRSLPVDSVRVMNSIIQIDAAINPGNSGGPLLNSRGLLIGMNTAIASSTGQSAGVGFAVPASSIARVVPQLITQGKVVRPDTGIVKVMQTEQGLIIAMMRPNSPAEQAGLRGFRLVKQRKTRGPFVYETQTVDRDHADTIIGVDGERVTKASDFLSRVEAKRPGDRVVLQILRQGQEMQVPMVLSAGE